MSEHIDEITRAFEGRVTVSEPFEQTVLEVPAEEIVSVVTYLKEHGYRLLLDISGTDYLPREPRFDVVYVLYHLERCEWLRLRVQVGGEEPEIDSVTGVFSCANWAEREVFDLLGIRFRGHPALKRILMPDDWNGHPLRKDYPLTGLDPLPPLVRE